MMTTMPFIFVMVFSALFQNIKTFSFRVNIFPLVLFFWELAFWTLNQSDGTSHCFVGHKLILLSRLNPKVLAQIGTRVRNHWVLGILIQRFVICSLTHTHRDNDWGCSNFLILGLGPWINQFNTIARLVIVSVDIPWSYTPHEQNKKAKINFCHLSFRLEMFIIYMFALNNYLFYFSPSGNRFLSRSQVNITS